MSSPGGPNNETSRRQHARTAPRRTPRPAPARLRRRTSCTRTRIRTPPRPGSTHVRARPGNEKYIREQGRDREPARQPGHHDRGPDEAAARPVSLFRRKQRGPVPLQALGGGARPAHLRPPATAARARRRSAWSSRSCSRSASYLAFTKHIPFTEPGLRAPRHVRERDHAEAAVAGADRGRQRRQGHHRERRRATWPRSTFTVDDEGLPIHKDATVTIRPRLFLEGNFFLDLRPGSPQRAGPLERRRRSRSPRPPPRCSSTRS